MIKNPNPGIFFFFFFVCVCGGRGGGYEHTRHHILYTRHIVTVSPTEPYSLMKIFLTVFKIEKIEGIVALTIKGR